VKMQTWQHALRMFLAMSKSHFGFDVTLNTRAHQRRVGADIGNGDMTPLFSILCYPTTDHFASL